MWLLWILNLGLKAVTEPTDVNEKLTSCFEITIKLNLATSHATRLKPVKYKINVIKEQPLK